MLSPPSLRGMLSKMASRSDKDMAVYSYQGEVLSRKEVDGQKSQYVERFAKVIGKCPSRRKEASFEAGGFGFLFCEEESRTARS